jgi:two-component system, OmpR family, alkaline phosphatase synthesis response regulator PhoP
MDTNVRKILIADDEPDILEILKYNLSSEGYQVITAKDGDEAIDRAKFSPGYDCTGYYDAKKEWSGGL